MCYLDGKELPEGHKFLTHPGLVLFRTKACKQQPAHMAAHSIEAVEKEPDRLNCRACAGGQHRSKEELKAWTCVLGLDLLQLPDVDDVIDDTWPRLSAAAAQRCSFVLEARVVQGWGGAVDIFELNYRIIIQIDGAQHDAATQKRKDDVCNAKAAGQGFRVLRVWHEDICKLGLLIDTAVALAGKEPQLMFCMHSGAHPRVPRPMPESEQLRVTWFTVWLRKFEPGNNAVSL